MLPSGVDPHTDYYSPRDQRTSTCSCRCHWKSWGAAHPDKEYTKVVELIKGGPAERGSELKPATGCRNGQGADGEIEDVVGMRLDDVVSQIRGEKILSA